MAERDGGFVKQEAGEYVKKLGRFEEDKWDHFTTRTYTRIRSVK